MICDAIWQQQRASSAAVSGQHSVYCVWSLDSLDCSCVPAVSGGLVLCVKYVEGNKYISTISNSVHRHFSEQPRFACRRLLLLSEQKHEIVDDIVAIRVIN